MGSRSNSIPACFARSGNADGWLKRAKHAETIRASEHGSAASRDVERPNRTAAIEARGQPLSFSNVSAPFSPITNNSVWLIGVSRASGIGASSSRPMPPFGCSQQVFAPLPAEKVPEVRYALNERVTGFGTRRIDCSIACRSLKVAKAIAFAWKWLHESVPKI